MACALANLPPLHNRGACTARKIIFVTPYRRYKAAKGTGIFASSRSALGGSDMNSVGRTNHNSARAQLSSADSRVRNLARKTKR